MRDFSDWPSVLKTLISLTQTLFEFIDAAGPTLNWLKRLVSRSIFCRIISFRNPPHNAPIGGGPHPGSLAKGGVVLDAIHPLSTTAKSIALDDNGAVRGSKLSTCSPSHQSKRHLACGGLEVTRKC